MQRMTLSITTCNRVNVFKKCFESFLDKCFNKNIFKEILIVDDNSTDEQINEMFMFLQKISPITFYLCCKKYSDRWQYKSLNIILDKATTDYILHIEDDYKFINRLGENTLIEAMEFSDDIKRCASISLNCIDPVFFKYETFKNKKYYEWDVTEKYICPVTKIKRPGFNLNPCIWNRKKFLDIGKFNLNYNKFVYDYNELHTEMDFGLRMIDRGYKHFMLDKTYTEYMLPPGGVTSAFFINQNILYKN